MRYLKYINRMVLVSTLVLLIAAFFVAGYAQADSSAAITGRVTVNGLYQDNVTVSIGDNTVKTTAGGYYTIDTTPDIAVQLVATYQGMTQKKSIWAGDAGTTVTLDFDVSPTPVPSGSSSSSWDAGSNPATLICKVAANDTPVIGLQVNVSENSGASTNATTDSTGYFTLLVPRDTVLTLSVSTSDYTGSKTITTPVDASQMAITFPLTSGTSAVAPTTAPVVESPTPAQQAGTTTASATVSPTEQTVVTIMPTSEAETTTATPAAASGSEILVPISIVGIIAAAGILRLKKL